MASDAAQQEYMPAPNEAFQFIDSKGEIADEHETSADGRSLNSFFSLNRNFLDKGFDYSVVAVLGPQSSGKSTLLNMLFGTHFAVMDAYISRTRTTQGVWMGVSHTEGPKDAEAVVVLDVEGTDSRERGEEDVAFERKTSLFSLALSSVLMINMWMHDIGRYNASNTALLKTVLELNLQLFQRSLGAGTTKTLLFFVIRDHTVTPLDALKGIIIRDIEEIWKSIAKPAEMTNSRLTDLFDMDFAALPHKVHQPEAFVKEVTSLRERFLNPNHPESILKREYRKGIPADGFYPFAYEVWQTIKANRDLDLPSQKEMLAMYRCEEIAEAAFTKFVQELVPIRTQTDKGVLVENYGAKASELLNNTLQEYEKPASRYHPETSARREAQLRGRVVSELFEVFSKQITRLGARAIQHFHERAAEVLPDPEAGTSPRPGKPSPSDITNFAEIAKKLAQESFEYFESNARASVLPDSEWTFQEEHETLVKVVEKEVGRLRKVYIAQLLSDIKDLLDETIAHNLTRVFDKAEPDMWAQARKVFQNGLETSEEQLRKRLVGFEVEGDAADEYIEQMRVRAIELVKTKLRERTEYLPMRMAKRFDEYFVLDERGLPRRWKKDDDVAAVFTSARERTEVLLERFSLIRLKPEDDKVVYLTKDEASQDLKPTGQVRQDDSRVVLNIDACEATLDRFRKETESAYLQALRDQESAVRLTGVPGYIIVLIIILGFNEFVALISNPFLLLLTLMVGGGLYVVYVLNLGGPVRGILESLLASFVDKLREGMQKVDAISHPAPPASPSRPPSAGSSRAKRE